MKAFENFLEWALSNNWQIVENDSSEYKPPSVYREKIGYFEDIIKKYKRISNAKSTIWLVVSECIYNTDPESFSWDEFKKISLSGCIDEDGKKSVVQWWDRHFPIIMSVENGAYEYYAIETISKKIGFSFEPFFEEEEIVAESLDDFFNKIIREEIVLDQ